VEAISVALSEGVELRGLQPDDTDVVHALVEAERKRLEAWMAFIYWTHSVEDVRNFIVSCRASETEVDGNGIWVDGALAGVVGMTVDRFNAGDIGYWLGSEFEGRGLMSAACRALIDHGFTAMGLHRVTITVEPENARSCAVPERLGFTREAVLREASKVGDRYGDFVVFGLLASEWPAS